MQAVRLLTEDGAVKGLLALDLRGRGPAGLTLFAADIIPRDRRPAAVYAQTVYPCGHIGGPALPSRRAPPTNLQELAVRPPPPSISAGTGPAPISRCSPALTSRWTSTAARARISAGVLRKRDGAGARYGRSSRGYQWPVRCPQDGWLVGHRTSSSTTKTVELGRKVYMDFRTDPKGLRADSPVWPRKPAPILPIQAHCWQRPIARLAHMNRMPSRAVPQPRHRPVQRAAPHSGMCAQHANGGVSVDANWQTTVRGLYAAGECAGTFGVYLGRAARRSTPPRGGF